MDDPVAIVGFDPGLGAPAYAVLSPDGEKIVKVNVMRPVLSPRVDWHFRAHVQAVNMVREVVAVANGPLVVGIEGPAPGSHGWMALHTLEACRQAIYSTLAHTLDDFTFETLSPSTVKNRCLQDGRGTKDDMLVAMCKRFRMNAPLTKRERYGIGDALGIAYTTHLRWEENK